MINFKNVRELLNEGMPTRTRRLLCSVMAEGKETPKMPELKIASSVYEFVAAELSVSNMRGTQLAHNSVRNGIVFLNDLEDWLSLKRIAEHALADCVGVLKRSIVQDRKLDPKDECALETEMLEIMSVKSEFLSCPVSEYKAFAAKLVAMAEAQEKKMEEPK